MLGIVLVVVVLVNAGSGLQWSDRLKSDEQPIQVCSGENIQLFWNFTLDKGERVKGMVWRCQPDGKQEETLATYVDGHFVPMSTFSGRLAHLQGGGIEVSCATILESGNYSITVSTEGDPDSLIVHRKTASVIVIDTPKTQTGEIHMMRKAEATRDVTTGMWHVQLSCGNFSDRGNPPVDVIWKTPRGDQLDSTSYQDGFFHLLLPNPLVGGNYACAIPPSQDAMKCLPRDTPLLGTASLEVEEIAGRFTLLEARQQEILDKLMVERINSMGFFEDLANRTDVLEHKLDEVFHDTVSVYFFTKLASRVTLSSGSILKLDKVISNQGDGYDQNTGYFTAPVKGIYFIIATTGPYGDENTVILVMLQEGKEVGRIYLRQEDNYNMGSCHAILSLKAGEKVWLQSAYSTSYFDHYDTAFSGFLL